MEQIKCILHYTESCLCNSHINSFTRIYNFQAVLFEYSPKDVLRDSDF